MSRKYTPISAREEKKRQRLDVCAIAAAQMILGEYKFPKGGKRQWDENGNLTYTMAELNRIWGLSDPDQKFPYVDDPYFVKRLEWELWRRTDPNMAHANMGEVWSHIIEDDMIALYERVHFHHESMSVTELIKVLDLGLKAGQLAKRIDPNEKVTNLMRELSPEKRAKLASEQRKQLERQRKLLDSLEDAHEMQDIVESEAVEAGL